MTTELALATPRLTPEAMTMIMNIAPTMHAARLFGSKSAEQAAAIMLKGYELGFSLSASFENIHVIEDKPSLSPKGALALIHNSPELAGLKITEDAKGCTVWMKRRNGFEYTVTFTLEDAKRADLIKPKSGWEKYPANMLRWRAIGYAADVVFPDVIGGTKRADEYGADLTPDGDVIEGSWSNVGSQQTENIFERAKNPPAVTVSPKSKMNLGMLMLNYTPAEIMAINNGVIPQTDIECAEVAAKLEARKVTGTPLTVDVDFGGVMSNE